MCRLMVRDCRLPSCSFSTRSPHESLMVVEATPPGSAGVSNIEGASRAGEGSLAQIGACRQPRRSERRAVLPTKTWPQWDPLPASTYQVDGTADQESDCK